MDGRTRRPATEVIGVVAKQPDRGPDTECRAEIYLSLWKASVFSRHLLVRTGADPRTVMGSMRREIHAVLPTAAVENMQTLEEGRGDSLATRFFAMRLL